MAKPSNEPDSIKLALESMLLVLQDIFILQALSSGARVDDIRKHLRLDKWRVSKISKLLKTGKRDPK